MRIDVAAIKALREKTGVGMSDAKEALHASGGDIERAIDHLKRAGALKAKKKSAREAREGLVHAYIHANGRVGVLLEINCETDFVAKNETFRALAHDIAMHIAAEDPSYVSKDDVPEEIIRTEEDIAREQLRGEGKDATIIAKALPGRTQKFYREHCLLEQPFVKDETMTVGELISKNIAVLGENIKVKRFVRFGL